MLCHLTDKLTRKVCSVVMKTMECCAEQSLFSIGGWLRTVRHGVFFRDFAFPNSGGAFQGN